jgi:hypothetical protein
MGIGKEQSISRRKSPWAATFAGLMGAILLAGCNDTSSLFGSASSVTSNFPGCISAAALDSTRINLDYLIPSGAVSMNLYRNGTIISNAAPSSSEAYTDFGLLEGETYTYTCEAVYADSTTAMGTQSVSATTVDVDAPTFSGVQGVSVLSASSARVSWTLASPTGVPTAYYQVFANPGTAVNWSLAPRATIAIGSLSTILNNLGQELQYAFGVNACSANNICSSYTSGNYVIVGSGPPATSTGATGLLATITSSGLPPSTQGAVSVSNGSGSVVITAPWQDSNGAVSNRLVYQMIGTPTLPVSLAQFSLAQTVAITNPQYGNVSSTITLTGLTDNTIYSWIVQDQDPLGHQSTNLNYVTYTTGDLTPPTFGGATTIALGTPGDQNVVIGFTAINREGNASGSTDPNDKNGVANYLVYLASTPCTQTGSVVTCNAAPNACASGAVYGLPLSASTYAPGPQTYTITGLSQRTTYSVCLKAEDAAGNISTNTIASSITTVDVTPPTFSGIQTLTYSNAAGTLDLTWNASTSSDTEKYVVSLWSGTSTPTAAQITTLVVGNPSAAAVAYTSAQFGMGNFEQVYAVVDACDNAELLPNGVQNCTKNLLTPSAGTVQTNAKELTLGAILPPQGFLGINPSLTTVGASQGTINVAWYAPSPTTDWSGYAGFHIYYLDSSNNLNFIQDCSCAESPCTGVSAQDKACTITGLSARRTYNLYVEGFDQYGNVTSYLSPVQNYAAAIRTSDTAPPTFTSNLTVGASPTFTLSWTAATDNQYATESGAVINYKLYQKVGTTFANAFQPYTDGVLRTTTQATSYTDAGFTQGDVYYYAVCALDASGNRTCDGNVQSFMVTDITPPVISSFTSTASGLLKQWTLNWAATDNVTPVGNIVYTIYRSYTPAAQAATTSDVKIFTGGGTTTLSGQTGATNTSGYANYLLQAKDQAGNVSTANLSIAYNNVITVTSISRSGGPNAGGKLVVIRGTGFVTAAQAGYAAGTTVTIGGTACTTPSVYTPTVISCLTPSGTGASDVVVTNPEGSTGTLTGGYTYSFASANICDNSGSWGTYFASGIGTAGSPFLVCTATQLANMGLEASNSTCSSASGCLGGNYTFQLADNIDLSSYNTNNYPPLGDGTHPFVGTFDGNNMMIGNWTYSTAVANSFVGLFASGNGTHTVKNLIMGNINLSATSGTSSLVGVVVGGNQGGASGATYTYSNLILSGSVTSSGGVGGLKGSAQNNGTDIFTNITSAVNVTATGTGASVYLAVGGIVGACYNATGCTFNNVTSSGTVTALVPPQSLGGLVGMIGACCGCGSYSMSNSSFTGSIIGTGSNIGGLAGAYCGQISNSYSTGNITITETASGGGNFGGLVGSWSASPTTQSIFQSYATGNIILPIGGAYTYNTVGGFVGALSTAGNVSQCYAKGNVIGDLSMATWIGGFVGDMSTAAVIVDSYATGNVQGNSSVGGFAGTTNNSVGSSVTRSFSTGNVSTVVGGGGFFGTTATNLTFTNTFWDTTTSGYSTSFGTPTGMNDANMKVESNFTGFDFTTVPVWKMSPVTGYPELGYQTP